MEQNDLDKVIKGTTTPADNEFMAQIADALRARKPMSAAERERYDSINKAREEELKLQKDAFKLEKEGKLNMDMKEHFKARINNQLNEINVFGAMRTASSKKESPLFAGAKAIGTNIERRGLLAGLGIGKYIKQYVDQMRLNLSPTKYDLGLGPVLMGEPEVKETHAHSGNSVTFRPPLMGRPEPTGVRYRQVARPPVSRQQTTEDDWAARYAARIVDPKTGEVIKPGMDIDVARDIIRHQKARLDKFVDTKFPKPAEPIERPSADKIARGKLTSLGRGRGKR